MKTHGRTVYFPFGRLRAFVFTNTTPYLASPVFVCPCSMSTPPQAPTENKTDMRFCRYCNCMLNLDMFPKQKAKRRVCRAHMRSIYQQRHAITGGGTIELNHFRVLKNAYQIFTRDARLNFGGLKPSFHIKDLASVIDASGNHFCVPRDPSLPISKDNVCILDNIEHRKTLLKLWSCTHDRNLYTATLSCFTSA